MNAIVCLDDRNGMLFHNRRQTRDKALIYNVVDLCNGHRLYMNDYTNGMFLLYGFTCQTEETDFLQTADEGDYCFIEDSSLPAFLHKVKQIIIYKWNRHYPGDVFFNMSDLAGWTLKETMDFSGSSHEKITREIYAR